MGVEIQIPKVLQQYVSGQGCVVAQGDTVGAAMSNLENEHPSLYVCICDETGKLRQHINLFVNGKLVSGPNLFSKRLVPGDVVSVFQAVSGG